MVLPSKHNKDWSKAYLMRPDDQILSHAKIKEPKFIPSYEKASSPTSMNWVLGWEYGRLWLEERSVYRKKRLNKEMRKRIKNDYQTWLIKRTPKPKKSLF